MNACVGTQARGKRPGARVPHHEGSRLACGGRRLALHARRGLRGMEQRMHAWHVRGTEGRARWADTRFAGGLKGVPAWAMLRQLPECDVFC